METLNDGGNPTTCTMAQEHGTLQRAAAPCANLPPARSSPPTLGQWTLMPAGARRELEPSRPGPRSWPKWPRALRGGGQSQAAG
eukprot:12203116-Alexandrium_andersonii.AAC.1